MQETIRDLAAGKFTYEGPNVLISSEKIEFEVLEEQTFSGNFTIKSTNNIPMKGFIYTSNGRMNCKNPKFEGTKVQIGFEFHSEGLIEGDIQKGEFSIICNDGEYSLSFVAIITALYPVSSIGKIKNVFDFANLSRKSYTEAFEIFTSEPFLRVIKKLSYKKQMIYNALCKKPVTMQNMEEFLCEIKKKTKVTFSVLEKEETQGELLQYKNDMQVSQETITIQKEQWGYLHIDVRVDSPAISLHQQHITNQDFVGNKASLSFIIDGNLLHKGNNFVSLYFDSAYQSIRCNMCIQRNGNHKKRQHTISIQKYLSQATHCFIDFRLGNILAVEYCSKIIETITELKALDSENKWYDLWKAQALIINKQNHDAQWLLNEFQKELKEEKLNTPIYGFYLYLTTLIDREFSYVKQTTQQIQEIYKINNHIITAWTLLYLDEQLNRNYKVKMDMLKGLFQTGSRHPVLYMEAYYLVRREPYLLTKPGRFELQVLNWITKSNKLTKEIAMQIRNLMPSIKKFYKKWYQIMVKCYELWPSKEMLLTICSYCIKWNCYGEKFFSWYQEGIKAELRITGLYEAWIGSADKEQLRNSPKNVLLYFEYHSSLSYKQQAALYAAMIESGDIHKNQYASYRHKVQLFAIEQLKHLRMDENLAVLYENMIHKEMLDESLAKALSKIIFINKIYCYDKKAVRVIVKHKELQEEQVVPLINNRANIHIYSYNYCILMEDGKGNRFISNYSWEHKRLMRPDYFLKKCLEFVPYELVFLIAYFDGKKTWQTLNQDDMDKLQFLLNSKKISNTYRQELKPLMIEFYYHTYTGESLGNYLHTIEYKDLSHQIKSKLIELFIAKDLYDRAFELMMKHGLEQVAKNSLTSVVSHKIEKIDYKKDDMLLDLSFHIFTKGKYNEVIISYMCINYIGTVKEMAVLWEAAREFEIDTIKLEERILSQLLYTTDFVYNMDQIFMSYCEARANSTMVKAYLSFFAYQFFVKEAVISDEILLLIEQKFENQEPLNEICRLAYFKWLSTIEELTEERLLSVKDLMESYLLQGRRFAFYTDFPMNIQKKYHLYDKIYLEYRTKPGNHVVIHYNNQETDSSEYIIEDMSLMFEGIYVKEFVVFFDDIIHYYIKECASGLEENIECFDITRSACLSLSEWRSSENDDSCYDLINGMMISKNMRDNHTLFVLMEQYHKMEEITNTLFLPL